MQNGSGAVNSSVLEGQSGHEGPKNPEVRKGLDLVFKSMFDVFTRTGLKPIEDSEVFDPNIHQAVDRGPAETDEDDQKILEVYQRGYHFKDRLLRPAMVKVAVKD